MRVGGRRTVALLARMALARMALARMALARMALAGVVLACGACSSAAPTARPAALPSTNGPTTTVEAAASTPPVTAPPTTAPPAAAPPAAAPPTAAPGPSVLAVPKPMVRGRWFSETSFWSVPVPATATVDPTIDGGRELDRLVKAKGANLNSAFYSTPVYRVRHGAPTVAVPIDLGPPSLDEAFVAVPLPPDAKPAAGTDMHLVVIDEDADVLWEMWQLRRSGSGWRASYGGRIDGLSQSSGHYEGDHSFWGATATSLPLIGGLITEQDLARGSIDHALAIALPDVAAGAVRFPAQRTDGGSVARTSLPAGAWLRLDPTIDLDRVKLTPLARMVGVAAQRYGVYVRDTAGAVALYAEDVSASGRDPYTRLLPDGALSQLPWSRFELLQPPVADAA